MSPEEDVSFCLACPRNQSDTRTRCTAYQPRARVSTDLLVVAITSIVVCCGDSVSKLSYQRSGCADRLADGIAGELIEGHGMGRCCRLRRGLAATDDTETPL